MVLATFVYYVEFNEENSVRQLDTIQKTQNLPDDIFKEINWENIKLFYQFKIAIDKCFKPDIDKHSYTSNNCSKEKIFSY